MNFDPGSKINNKAASSSQSLSFSFLSPITSINRNLLPLTV
jgi:hypothetical protein